MIDELRAPELVSLGYFLILVCLAWLRPVSAGGRLMVTLMAAAVWLVNGAAAGLAAARMCPQLVAVIRDWLPLPHLVLAYWTPRALVTGVNIPFERWLSALDDRFLSSAPGRLALRAPRLVRELLELSYTAVYPIVPLALGLLLVNGFRSEVDRFWSTVLLAEYACYGLLPLLPTRPPRAVARGPGAAATAEVRAWGTSTVRRLNSRILAAASNGWNTFPSGHVAGSLACGLAVWSSLPALGGALIVVGLMIAAASVLGRYHYSADALAGAVVAAVAYAIVGG
jgi:hypothetical protein